MRKTLYWPKHFCQNGHLCLKHKTNQCYQTYLSLRDSLNLANVGTNTKMCLMWDKFTECKGKERPLWLTKTEHRCPHEGCILSFHCVERKSERSEFPLFLLLLFSLFRVWLPIWTIQDEPDETMKPHSLITQFTPCNIKQALIWSTGELWGHSCLMFFIMKTPLLSNYAHRGYCWSAASEIKGHSQNTREHVTKFNRTFV